MGQAREGISFGWAGRCHPSHRSIPSPGEFFPCESHWVCRGGPTPPGSHFPEAGYSVGMSAWWALKKWMETGQLGSGRVLGPRGCTPIGPSCPPGSPQRSIPGSWRSSPLPLTSTLTFPASESPLGTPRRESGTSTLPSRTPSNLHTCAESLFCWLQCPHIPVEDPCMGGGWVVRGSHTGWEGGCGSELLRPWPTGGGPNRTSITASS